MAKKGTSSTPEIKINFSYESKASAKKKLGDRLKEIQEVAKPIMATIDFKTKGESMKSLKVALGSIKGKLDTLTLDTLNKNLEEALRNATKLTSELEKANKSPYARRVVAKDTYDVKSIKEAEKETLASIKTQEKAYSDMVKKKTKELRDLTKEQVKSAKEATDAIAKLEAKQKAVGGKEAKKQVKLDIDKGDYQRTIDLLTQSGNISSQVLRDMQSEFNKFTTKTSVKEIDDFENRLKTLGTNDKSIASMSKKFESMGARLSELRSKAIELDDTKAIAQLNRLEKEMNDVKVASTSMSNGMAVNMNGVTPELSKIDAGLKQVSKSMRESTIHSNSFGASFKEMAKTFGLLSIGYEAVQLLSRSFRDGFGSVVKMDTALANLNKVVDLSKTQLDGARDSAVEMGKALGRSSIDVANAQAEFGRVYKDLKSINEMTKISIMGANVMDGTNPDEVAKGLSTVMNSMKMEQKDAMTIIDSMNEVQNNYRISSDSMLESLSKVGSTAYTAGASLQELEGYITAITVATGASGEEVGNSLKSLMAKVYKIGSEGKIDALLVG